jgi:hypothetical protein
MSLLHRRPREVYRVWADDLDPALGTMGDEWDDLRAPEPAGDALAAVPGAPIPGGAPVSPAHVPSAPRGVRPAALAALFGAAASVVAIAVFVERSRSDGAVTRSGPRGRGAGLLRIPVTGSVGARHPTARSPAIARARGPAPRRSAPPRPRARAARNRGRQRPHRAYASPPMTLVARSRLVARSAPTVTGAREVWASQGSRDAEFAFEGLGR